MIFMPIYDNFTLGLAFKFYWEKNETKHELLIEKPLTENCKCYIILAIRYPPNNTCRMPVVFKYLSHCLKYVFRLFCTQTFNWVTVHAICIHMKLVFFNPHALNLSFMSITNT